MKNSFFLLCFCWLLSNCVSKPTVPTTTKSPSPIAPNIPVINANTPKEKAVLAKPFVGVTTNGEIQKDLFSVKETGISTESIQQAVNDFLGSLSSQQQQKCSFPIDNKEWRRWHNIDEYERQGIALFDMSEEQKALVFKILEASLSPQGVEKSKNIMKMEGYLKILAKRFKTRQSTLDKLGGDVRDRNGARPSPVKWHVHTVVRTPNGNDYGKDLLRQHLEAHH